MKHPSSFLSTEHIQLIKEFIAIAEDKGCLHSKQLDLIYEQGWFNLFVPKTFGGLECSLPEALQIEEGLAWTDGSFGWTVTLCSGANWFIGFMDTVVAKEIFNNPQVCLAGSGRPSGRAIVKEEGYEITGSWQYATGAPHATAFTANCFIEKDGHLVKDENGNLKILSFWFKKEEVQVNNNWNVIGMIATASHAFSVNKLHVSSNRSFIINEKHRQLTQPVFGFPFLQFAEATLAVNYSGMAVRFLDLCNGVLKEKENKSGYTENLTEVLRQKLDKAVEQLDNARNNFYTAVETGWQQLMSNEKINNDLLENISSNSRHLASLSRQVVDDLYPYCGLSAANPKTEINRVWRNLHTASQHTVLL